MSTIESRKKAKDNYHKTIKNIAVQIKTESEQYKYITDIVDNYNVSYSNVIKCLINYCIDNNIDIKSYIK